MYSCSSNENDNGTDKKLTPPCNSKENVVVVCSGLTSLSNIFQPHQDGFVFVLRLNVPVNNFSVMSGRSHRFLGN